MSYPVGGVISYVRVISCVSYGIYILAGDRVLHMAAERGSYDMLRLLLNQALADPNVADHASLTPLAAVCV